MLLHISPTREQRLLINVHQQKTRLRLLQTPPTITQPPIQRTADERAKQIAALKQKLKKEDAEELLAACTDTRTIEKEIWQELTGEDMANSWNSAGTVGRLAWKQLAQAWNMDTDARNVVIHTLDDGNAILCAGAALLLQQSKRYFTEDECKQATQKIMAILRDEELSRRPLDPPDNSSKIWRLDDVLFEALRVLAD